MVKRVVWWLKVRRAVIWWWLQRVVICRNYGHSWCPAYCDGKHIFDRCHVCQIDRPTAAGLQMFPRFKQYGARIEDGGHGW